MTEPLRDIRDFSGDADAYRDELFRRWTGLLSYRYIGRNHSSMNVGETDDTVTIRRDMRNEAGGIMVAPLAIASPEGCQADLVAVPNPVIASVQIVDPGYDVKKVEVVESGNVHQGRMMGYGRCKIVDADNPDRVIAFNEGQGAIIGVPPEGLEKMDVSGTELVIEDSPDLPPLWKAFGASKRPDGPTPTGNCRPSVRSWPLQMRRCTSGRSTWCSKPPRSIWPPTRSERGSYRS